MSRIRRLSLPSLLLFSLIHPALAAPAQWETVAVQAGSMVDLDKSRISRLKDGKTAAWTQLTLDHPVLDFENQQRYTVVQALNHYDCAQRSFAAQKRIYLLDGRAVKTEPAKNARPVAALPDSLDARLLDEVCKPRTVGEIHRAAALAAKAAESVQANQPRAMHAEMVANAEAAPAVRAMKVSDAHAPAPAAPAAAAAAATDKRRYIEMPAIDKSKVEDPYKNSSPPAAAHAVAAPAAATVKPVTPPPQLHAAPSASLAKSHEPAPAHELTRQQRELMLATSGLRKAKPKSQPQPVAEPQPDFSHVHWGYAGLGAPENWAKIKPGYSLCAGGTRQSPIDIRNGIKVDLEQIRFDYRNTPFRVVDNGHTVQVNVGEGSSISLMGRSYPLVQFHFHRPSEERINGKPFDMVIHLVHKDYDNNLAVVAVLIEKGPEHPTIQTLWNHMPLEVGQEMAPPNLMIDLAKLLPQRRDYYTYMGSLTTPPCTENVLWLVFKTPIQLSPEQVGIFARLYPNNARPVQSSSDRLIKESR